MNRNERQGASRRSERGFTLIELMIVVAIIAIVTTMAFAYPWAKSRPVDAAARIGNLVETAARIAIRNGTLSAATATAQGSTRRTRIVATAGSPVWFTLQELVETPSVAWNTVEQVAVPSSVTANAFAYKVGTYTAVSSFLVTNWSSFELSCFPDGTCTSATLFFSSPINNSKGRLSVLPLGGATNVRKDW